MIHLIPNENIAVSPLFDKGISAGGLYIPDSAIERCDQGIVKYIGKGVPLDVDLKIGDHVLFSGYTGTLLAIEGEGDLIIFNYQFAICKIDDDPTVVNGLFFKIKRDKKEIIDYLAEKIKDYFTSESGIEGQNLEHFRSIAMYLYSCGIENYGFQPALYEHVTSLISESLDHRKVKITNKKESREDEFSNSQYRMT